MSRKLQRFEQSKLEARFAIPESTLITPKYRVRNFEEKKFVKFSELFWELTKKRHNSYQSYLDARFATPESTLIAYNYTIGNFKFE